VNGRFLLDTNVIISLFSNDPGTHKRISEVEDVFVPCIVIGELYFGAYKSSRVKENRALISEFALNNVILPCNEDTAILYGEIKNHLREKGLPIPENDIWIAAIARQYSLTLITRDVHFESVDNLKIELW
jgi:tRNA(fMet)-specific endonuclease VapC